MEKEKKEKEKKEMEDGKDVANYMMTQEEEEQESDEDIDNEDQFNNIINSFYAGPTNEEIDEEIQRALDDRMQLDTN